jgi:F-type H+-transporting ATPase subunit b
MVTLLVPLAENPLFPEPLEIIMSVIFAVVLIVVLSKVVVPRFEQTYAERTAAIQGGIEKAEQAQREAAAALQKYEAQLAEARGEAGKIRDEAREQGKQILAEMREQAQTESARIIAAGQSQIEAERNQAVNQLRSEIGGLATTLAGRIVGESLEDDERARRTVDRFLADLESQSAGSEHANS